MGIPGESKSTGALGSFDQSASGVIYESADGGYSGSTVAVAGTTAAHVTGDCLGNGTL